MSYWTDPRVPIPPEIVALEKALDDVINELQLSKDKIEADDLWPPYNLPNVDKIEDQTIKAESASLDVKFLVLHLYGVIHEMREQRDAAIKANLEGYSLLEGLPDKQAWLIRWLVSVLHNHQQPNDYSELRERLDRLLVQMANVRRKLEGEDYV